MRQKTVIVENASFSETNRKRSKNTTGSLGAEGRADGPNNSDGVVAYRSSHLEAGPKLTRHKVFGPAIVGFNRVSYLLPFCNPATEYDQGF